MKEKKHIVTLMITTPADSDVGPLEDWDFDALINVTNHETGWRDPCKQTPVQVLNIQPYPVKRKALQ